MDSRKTLVSNETFMGMLSGCKENNQKVAMLIDQTGIERREGLIKEIVTNVNEPYIELDNGSIILINTIVAVNGVFISSYSEC